MSIAVSILVRPSRTARRLLLVWGLAQAAAAVAIVALPLPLRTGAAPWLAAALAGAGLLLAGRAARAPKMHQIDISGTGELRVTVQQGLRMPRQTRCMAGGPGAGAAESAALALLPGSVSWPWLMLLRLGAADGQAPASALVVAIWRDSVDREAWRALAVALGVIGGPRARRDGGGKNR